MKYNGHFQKLIFQDLITNDSYGFKAFLVQFHDIRPARPAQLCRHPLCLCPAAPGAGL